MTRRSRPVRLGEVLLMLLALLAVLSAAPRAEELLAEPAPGAMASGTRDPIRGEATPAPRADGEQTGLHAGARNDHKTSAATGLPFNGDDPGLMIVWQRGGCHLNPGNPSCVLLGMATSCASAPHAAVCTADSDGDSCLDVAELPVGLDPFQPADCVGDRHGRPLLNCLFLSVNMACDREGAPASATPTPCAADSAACFDRGQTAALDCPLLARDPSCDGFAPIVK